MILTAHQPVYLPWLGLFHKIALADKFIIFDQVQYVPKDYISRNLIKTAHGQLLLTVPVFTRGYLNKVIAEIEINNNERWARKHWKSILINYKQAPYFKNYADFFEYVYTHEWKYLTELNSYMLKFFLKKLGINVPVEHAGSYDFKGVKSDLVLDMCSQLGADIYIFGALGKDYADVEKFKKAGVKLIFQSYNNPNYTQLHGKFLPNMSVVDLLFNEGPKSLEIIMSNNLSKQDLKKAF